MVFSCDIPRYVRVQAFVAACLNLSEVINGYGVAWAGPILPKFDDLNQSPLSYRITETQKSWIASIMFLGCIGAFLGGYLGNLIGRKKALITGGVLHLASYCLLAFARSLPLLFVARFMVGISICFVMTISAIYIGEIASPNIRGIVMTSLGVSHAIGSLLVYSIGPFFQTATVSYVGIVINIFLIIACCCLPESPMFFVLKDDEDSARKALLYLGRPDDTGTELNYMMEKAREQRNTMHIWKHLFKSKSDRKSLFITVSLSIFQFSSGIMTVIVYANTIFRYAGSSIHPDIASIIVAATFTVGAIVAPIFVDKYGRRVLLKTSTSALSVTMAGLGVYFYLNENHPPYVEKLGWLPLVLLVIAQFAYSFGLSIIPNTLPGELFSPKVRGLGSSISVFSGILSALISITLFGYIVQAVGVYFTFWLFSICDAFAFLFVIFLVPETMGKTLMQIQKILEN